MEPEIKDLAKDYVPPHVVLELAGKEVTVYKMSLRSFERLARIAEPHMKDIIGSLFGTSAFTEARAGKKVAQEEAQEEIKALFKDRIGELAATVPTIVLQFLACIMDIPEEGPIHDFFWNEISLEELLDSVEKLDELNDFGAIVNRLITLLQYLAKRYGINIAEVTVVGKTEES